MPESPLYSRAYRARPWIIFGIGGAFALLCLAMALAAGSVGFLIPAPVALLAGAFAARRTKNGIDVYPAKVVCRTPGGDRTYAAKELELYSNGESSVFWLRPLDANGTICIVRDPDHERVRTQFALAGVTVRRT